MKAPVTQAIEDLRRAFGEVTLREDGEGGAYVVVEEVSPGQIYKQPVTWIGFRITFQYPYADVYPLYVRADLTRTDGKPVVGGGIQANHTFEGRAALQISRRSNRLDPVRDTAVLKAEKVLHWLSTRP